MIANVQCDGQGVETAPLATIGDLLAELEQRLSFEQRRAYCRDIWCAAIQVVFDDPNYSVSTAVTMPDLVRPKIIKSDEGKGVKIELPQLEEFHALTADQLDTWHDKFKDWLSRIPPQERERLGRERVILNWASE